MTGLDSIDHATAKESKPQHIEMISTVKPQSTVTATATTAGVPSSSSPVSLTALSSTLSASSSLSGSVYNPSATSPALTSSRFKHYHKPTVSENPHLVFLCQRYIHNNDIDGLAAIARQRGLPPSLRQYAWPMLLRSHPYVLSPSIVAEIPTASGQRPSELVPLKRIHGDINRCRNRLANKPLANNNSTTNGGSSKSQGLNGSRTPGTPASTSSPIPELPDADISELINALQIQKFQVIQDAIENFLHKYGHLIPYESGMVWMAVSLADWVDPIYRLHEPAPMSDSQRSTPELTPIGSWDPLNSHFDFIQLFEQLMLVIFHAQDPPVIIDEQDGSCDSPVTDRISLFLSVLRKLIPDLSSHFDEEDVLNCIGGDEWLLWWIKWFGAKVWDKHDRARIWDMYLGWRPNATNISKEDFQDNELGVDPFWNPMELESTSILDLHTQHLFVCIAVLKSKTFTLMELDQSEIRETLTRIYRSKDIERVIQEAGESWRSWHWEESDTSDQ